MAESWTVESVFAGRLSLIGTLKLAGHCPVAAAFEDLTALDYEITKCDPVVKHMFRRMTGPLRSLITFRDSCNLKFLGYTSTGTQVFLFWQLLLLTSNFAQYLLQGCSSYSTSAMRPNLMCLVLLGLLT